MLFDFVRKFVSQNLIFVFSPFVETQTSHNPPLFTYFINRSTFIVEINTYNLTMWEVKSLIIFEIILKSI